MRCFRNDADHLGLSLRILAADLRPELSPACYLADHNFAVPRCLDDAYIPALLRICSREGVQLLVPTIDTELPVLAAHVAAFAAVGTRVMVSSPEVVAIARDKLLTAEVFGRAGVTVPRTCRLTDMVERQDGWSWPAILKPVGGSSSIGLAVVHTWEEARRVGSMRDDYLVQELWSGLEYTVNMFFGRQGVLACVVPHRRLETRGGEVSKGRTERVAVLHAAAEKIAAALPGARGALCFQAILDETGAAGVFEINARFGGGYPLAHRAGATFSKWLLEEALGLPNTASNDWRENVTMLRYDTSVFIDG